jgi:DNA-binding XRE family transcriptional regulator
MERVQIEAIFRKHAGALVDDIMGLVSKRNMVPELGDNMQDVLSYRAEAAKRIHGTRSRKGMTRETLAELANVQVRVLENIEAGTYWPKDGRILMDIAHALGLQAFDLDPRFDPGGPLSSLPAPGITKSEYLDYTRDTYSPERLANDGKDSDGIG